VRVLLFRTYFGIIPKSIKLFNDFSTVLIMDSTYKTNTYKMPLFEIVEVTSTDMTYSVAFAFLIAEKEDNFVWVLHLLLQLLSSKKDMPNVVVTDRDTVLMNALATVLPKTTALLCYFHFCRNDKVKCIIGCRVKPKDVKLDEKEKVVKEEKPSDIVNNIMKS